MSGKSNLVDAFKLLLTLLTPGSPQRAFNDRNGYAEVLWKGSPEGVLKLGVDGQGAVAGG